MVMNIVVIGGIKDTYFEERDAVLKYRLEAVSQLGFEGAWLQPRRLLTAYSPALAAEGPSLTPVRMSYATACSIASQKFAQ
jgi:hypothetical protein